MIANILFQFNTLIAASTRVDEQSYRITIEGNSLNADLIQTIKDIIQLSIGLGGSRQASLLMVTILTFKKVMKVLF